jgi:hypothetical protein
MPIAGVVVGADPGTLSTTSLIPTSIQPGIPGTELAGNWDSEVVSPADGLAILAGSISTLGGEA